MACHCKPCPHCFCQRHKTEQTARCCMCGHTIPNPVWSNFPNPNTTGGTNILAPKLPVVF